MDGNQPMLVRDDDAPLLVRILAASLGRAAAQPKVARDLRRLRGRVGLRSTVGPQAATIDFAGRVVRVTHGVGPDVDVLIEGDLETMGRPGAAKPKVSGAVHHPRPALGTGRPSTSAGPAAPGSRCTAPSGHWWRCSPAPITSGPRSSRGGCRYWATSSGRAASGPAVRRRRG